MRTRRKIIPADNFASPPFRPWRRRDALVFAVWGDCPDGVTIGLRTVGGDYEFALSGADATMIADALKRLSAEPAI